MNPIDQIIQFWKEAREKKDPALDSMYLATVDAEGRPYVRTVLLKQVPDGRFGFVSRLGGKKHEHIAHKNDVECCLHWSTLCLQVRLRCTTEKMDSASLGYFWQLRPREAQIVYSMDFEQSQEIESFSLLEQLFKKAEKQFQKLKSIPLSKFYTGYFLKPYQIEFLWHQQSRLNRRELYKNEEGTWVCSTLTP